MRQRIAFDLDETLGVPVIDGDSITGFRLRDGAADLLNRLRLSHSLLLWTVSNRSYLDKALSYGLSAYFAETYSWDDLAVSWKDIRRINADYLIDDSEHHKEEARKYGIADSYIVIAAYGSPEDQDDPLLWIRQIELVLPC
ncbi:MAG TPA: hypothetical protein VFD58_30635 [Blastocatellia bacterium]|nr:hypothetical protein [Blastocatellia bacterium]